LRQSPAGCRAETTKPRPKLTHATIKLGATEEASHYPNKGALMQKSQSESAIRRLCHDWRRASGLTDAPAARLSFIDFMSWLQSHHPDYLKFRSSISVRYDVELWFDQEFSLAGQK